MFLDFFFLMKEYGLAVSVHEYLHLMEGLKKNVVGYSIEDFYFLCKTVFVKHETNLDKFDRIFGFYFRDIKSIGDDFFETEIPEEWLKSQLIKTLTEEEKAMIDAMGGLDKLMERFKELLEKQDEAHSGGNQFIGIGGTSPYGANGYNPEGFRIGQEKGRNRSAIKVWDKRAFRNLNEDVELNTRNLKVALKRLRNFTREGAAEELDIDDTIQKTSENGGYLDIRLVPSKQNKVKVLLLMDVGGSMDDHVDICERLFSAARYEFKHLEYFYFHNCLYETLWQDNQQRHEKRIKTMEVLNKYNKTHKIIFVGDAAMSPYEIISEGGSVEHYNDEAGITWLQRFKDKYDRMAWINPNPEDHWDYYHSTRIIKDIFEHNMFPLTVSGITKTMRYLSR